MSRRGLGRIAEKKWFVFNTVIGMHKRSGKTLENPIA